MPLPTSPRPEAGTTGEPKLTSKLELYSDGGSLQKLMGEPVDRSQLFRIAQAKGAAFSGKFIQECGSALDPRLMPRFQDAIGRFADGFMAYAAPGHENTVAEAAALIHGALDYYLKDPDLDTIGFMPGLAKEDYGISTIGLGLYTTGVMIVDPGKSGTYVQIGFFPTIAECQKGPTIIKSTEQYVRAALVAFGKSTQLGAINVDVLHAGTPWESSRISEKYRETMRVAYDLKSAPRLLRARVADLLNLPWPPAA